MKKLYILVLFFCFTGISQEVKVFKIQGNKKTKSSLIAKLCKIKSGNILDSIQMEEDVRRLKRLPALAHAYYKVKKIALGYEVVYEVEENFTIIPSANVYLTHNDELAYKLGLYEFNALGQNITFGGFYQKNIYDSYGILFRAPFLFGKKLGVAVNYKNQTTQEPVFLDSGKAYYEYSNVSYEALGLYQFDFKNRIELGMAFFNEGYNYLTGETDPEVSQNFDVDKVRYKGIYEYNDINYHFQYVSGFKSLLNLEYINSSKDVLPDFVIGWNDFSYYRRIGAKGNWASRLRLGLATNHKSPFAPFSLDNNLNIRGVGSIVDRGTGTVVINTEYRHTLIDKNWFVLQSNVFVDLGSWRKPKGDFGDFVDAEIYRVYPGVGLRFMHKRIFKAIFRIDYGYGITKNDTHGLVFGIGQYF